jgi:hypothetical protein
LINVHPAVLQQLHVDKKQTGVAELMETVLQYFIAKARWGRKERKEERRKAGVTIKVRRIGEKLVSLILSSV